MTRRSPQPQNLPSPPGLSPFSKDPKDVAKALSDASEPLRKPLPSTLSVGRKEENRFIREDIKDRQLRRRLQNRVAQQIVSLTKWWLLGVFCVIVASGIGNAFGGFIISDMVILALLGTVTTNIIGLFIVLANHLFPTRKSPTA